MLEDIGRIYAYGVVVCFVVGLLLQVSDEAKRRYVPRIEKIVNAHTLLILIWVWPLLVVVLSLGWFVNLWSKKKS